jgi:transcriptional regulator with XRE-family HTH domain
MLLTNYFQYAIVKSRKLHNATDEEVNKVVNTNKIKGRMRELEITQADVARYLNIAQPTVNQKINNVRDFDLVEAQRLSELLKIKPDEFAKYFFWSESCIMQSASFEEGEK